MTGRPTKSLEVLKERMAEEKKKNKGRRHRGKVGAPGMSINFRPHIHMAFKRVMKDKKSKTGQLLNTVSSAAMTVINNMCSELLDRVCDELHELKTCDGKSIVKHQNVVSAFKLLFPGELAKHAVSEAVKAVVLYNRSLVRAPPPPQSEPEQGDSDEEEEEEGDKLLD